MRIKILGSSIEDPANRQYLSSYLVNETVAIDAGCLGQHRMPVDQARVKHVFLTHSHVDHTGSLPVFVENVYGLQDQCPVVYGNAETLEALRKDVFNDGTWPDFFRLGVEQAPFLRLSEVCAEVPIYVDGLCIIPVKVNHLVPTLAYVVQGPDASVVFAADSGPTERLWDVALEAPDLKAVFLEASFPNAQQWLADVSLHLTPQTFATEAAKLPPSVAKIAVHIKPRYRETVVKELLAANIPGLSIGACEAEYDF